MYTVQILRSTLMPPYCTKVNYRFGSRPLKSPTPHWDRKSHSGLDDVIVCSAGFALVDSTHPCAPVFGTFQVQNPGGKGIIAGGTNHGGDTDWTEESIPFMTPADGKVRICVFFVGFGKGTGTAWFDGLRLEEVDLARAPLKITREFLTDGKINPMQYGQFIEYLCDLVPGMWAEKLYDGGFEGLSPYNFYYLKETDFREKPWHPFSATNRADFVRDTNKPVGGKLAQKISVPAGGTLYGRHFSGWHCSSTRCPLQFHRLFSAGRSERSGSSYFAPGRKSSCNLQV